MTNKGNTHSLFFYLALDARCHSCQSRERSLLFLCSHTVCLQVIVLCIFCWLTNLKNIMKDNPYILSHPCSRQHVTLSAFLSNALQYCLSTWTNSMWFATLPHLYLPSPQKSRGSKEWTLPLINKHEVIPHFYTIQFNCWLCNWPVMQKHECRVWKMW